MTVKSCYNIAISCAGKKGAQHSTAEIQELMKKMLPEDMLNLVYAQKKRLEAAFMEKLPIFHWEYLDSSMLSVVFLSKNRAGLVQFFYEMITKWLVPGKRLESTFFFSSDIYLPEFSSSLLTISQIVVVVQEQKDRNLLEKNRSRIDSELRLGAHSDYHANRILTFKELSPDKKTEMIQRKISSLIQNKSENYDHSMFAQMQRFLVTSKEEFKNLRSSDHISRMISFSHVLRKKLQSNKNRFPTQRHVLVKVIKTKIAADKKPVLGVFIALNFLQEHEVFSEKHFRKALEGVYPQVRPVENSFLLDRAQNSALQLLYLEVEKVEEKDFSTKEMQEMRLCLPDLVKNHIEHLTHPVFMPRNEEEIFRNIMTLAKQLKYVDDIPQIIINFDEQSAGCLRFTIVFLRIVKSGQKEMKELLEQLPTSWPWRLERSRKAGTLRRKYLKEAHVFSVNIPSSFYLQDNHYVDLYQARTHLLEKITEIFGDIRDYNGGMIRKDTELLHAWKQSLGSSYKAHHFFLEKLFFSLQPSEIRNLLSGSLLTALFLTVMQSLKRKTAAPLWHIRKKEGKPIFVCGYRQMEYRQTVFHAVQKAKYPSYELLSFSLEDSFGFVLLSDDLEKKCHLEKILRKASLGKKITFCEP